MIEQVKHVNPELHLQPFRQLVLLGQAEVEILVIRPHKGVAAKIAEMLLANHADKEIKDMAGKTALDHATEAGHEDIVNLFTTFVPK